MLLRVSWITSKASGSLLVQDNHTGIYVEDLNTAGKSHERLFPVGMPPHDQ